MSSVVDRHLMIVLLVVALAGTAIMLPTGGTGATSRVSIQSLPRAAAEWMSVDGAPEDIVPREPNALEAVRRTYTDGTSTVWVVVARYGSMADPRRRPLLASIIPAHDPTKSSRDRPRIALNGSHDGQVVNRFVQNGARHVSLVFWYQLGSDVVVGDYQLRSHVLFDGLVGRHRDLLLVRVATVGPDPPEKLLRALYPQILALQS